MQAKIENIDQDDIEYGFNIGDVFNVLHLGDCFCVIECNNTSHGTYPMKIEQVSILV